MQGRRQRHHRVKADVVFAAKGARVREGAGGDELSQIGAGFEFVSERGQEFVRGGFLHEPHERFERAEVEGVGRVGGESRSEAKFARHAATDGGNQHAAADVSQELAAGFGGIHVVPEARRLWDHDILIVLIRNGVKCALRSCARPAAGVAPQNRGHRYLAGGSARALVAGAAGSGQSRGFGCGCRGGVGAGQFFGEDGDGDAAIAGAAFGSGVVGDGAKLTVAHRSQAARVHAGNLGQETDGGRGAGGGEFPVAREPFRAAARWARCRCGR